MSLPKIPRYRAAAIQFEPVMGGQEGDVTALLELTLEAAASGAKLIVLPGMALPNDWFCSRREVEPPLVERLTEALLLPAPARRPAA